MKKDNLNSEEKDLLDSFEQSEWRTVKNLKHEKLLAKKKATKTLSKDISTNRFSNNDRFNGQSPSSPRLC